MKKTIRLTESNLNSLIKMAINEEIDKNAAEMAKSLIGKKVHTPWTGKKIVTDFYKQKANTLPYADKHEKGFVFVFCGGDYSQPFMNLTPSELYELIQDGEMDNIILINDEKTERWLDEHDRNLKENPPLRNGKPWR